MDKLVLIRVPNWQANFADFVLQKMRLNNQGLLTFDWDPSTPDALNCLQFASEAVEAITGVNVYEEVASGLAYASPKEAYKVLQGLGVGSVDQLIGSLFDTKHVNYLIQGDLLIVPGHLGEAEEDPEVSSLEGLRGTLAVADPPFFWVVSSEAGLGKGHIYDVAAKYDIKAYAVAS